MIKQYNINSPESFALLVRAVRSAVPVFLIKQYYIYCLYIAYMYYGYVLEVYYSRKVLGLCLSPASVSKVVSCMCSMGMIEKRESDVYVITDLGKSICRHIDKEFDKLSTK